MNPSALLSGDRPPPGVGNLAYPSPVPPAIVSRSLLVQEEDRRLFKRRKIGNVLLKETVQVDLRPPLIAAQAISFFPIYGITSTDPHELSFVWRSPRMAYCFAILSSTIFFTILTINRFIYEGINYRSFGDLLFYAGTGFLSFKYLRLAMVWRDFMCEWVSIQEFMTDMKDVPIRKKIRIITIWLVISSVSEHLLSNSETFLNFGSTESGDRVEGFLHNRHRQIFMVFPYSLPLGLFANLSDFIVTLGWNFNDIFLTTVSLALGKLFKQFALDLENNSRKVTPESSLSYWRKRREVYNRLSLLMKLADEKLSLFIVFSFGMNLYYICIQLLHTIKPMQSITNLMYFAGSFGHLLCRTFAVCFAASSIFENSKEPLPIIYSVPSDLFNVEVQRLQTQVASETLALSGYNFFTVTRTLILTVAGTIVTYEIVLFQFSSLGPGDDGSGNAASPTLANTSASPPKYSFLYL